MPNPFETEEWAVLKEWSQAVLAVNSNDPRSMLRLRAATKRVRDMAEINENIDSEVELAISIQAVKDAAAAGMVIEEDNEGQVVIYTGLAYPGDDDLPSGSIDDLVLFEPDEDDDPDDKEEEE